MNYSKAINGEKLERPTNTFSFIIFIIISSLLVTSILYTPFNGGFVRFYPVLISSISSDLLNYDPYIETIKMGIFPEFVAFIFIYKVFASIVSTEIFAFYVGFFGLFFLIFIIGFLASRLGNSFLLPLMSMFVVLVPRYIGFGLGEWWAIRYEFFSESWAIPIILLGYVSMRINYLTGILFSIFLCLLIHPPLGILFLCLILCVFGYSFLQKKYGTFVSTMIFVIPLVFFLYTIPIIDNFLLSNISIKEFEKIFVNERHPHHFIVSWQQFIIFSITFFFLVLIGFMTKIFEKRQELYFFMFLFFVSLITYSYVQYSPSKIIYLVWPIRLFSISGGLMLAYVSVGIYKKLVLQIKIFDELKLQKLFYKITLGMILSTFIFTQINTCRSNLIVSDMCRVPDISKKYAKIVELIDQVKGNNNIYLVSNLAFFRTQGYNVHSGNVFWFNNPKLWKQHKMETNTLKTTQGAKSLIPKEFEGIGLAVIDFPLLNEEPFAIIDNYYVYRL